MSDQVLEVLVEAPLAIIVFYFIYQRDKILSKIIDNQRKQQEDSARLQHEMWERVLKLFKNQQ